MMQLDDPFMRARLNCRHTLAAARNSAQGVAPTDRVHPPDRRRIDVVQNDARRCGGVIGALIYVRAGRYGGS